MLNTDWWRSKTIIKIDESAQILAEKHFKTKDWHEMNQAERQRRIKQLWTKARMFVRLRRSLDSVKKQAEERERLQLFQQQSQDLSDVDRTDFNSDDEKEILNTETVNWYQFNTHSSSMKAWDSFFALIVLLNIILTPLTICFRSVF